MHYDLLFKVTVETSKRVVTTKDDSRLITPTKIFYFMSSEMAAHFVTRLSHKVKYYNEVKKLLVLFNSADAIQEQGMVFSSEDNIALFIYK